MKKIISVVKNKAATTKSGAMLVFSMLTVLFPGTGNSITFNEKEELLTELVRLNDVQLAKNLNHQWTDKSAIYYGAVFDNDSVVSPMGTSGFIQTLICSYVTPQSKYYQDEDLLSRMTLAARALLELQHEDGTIDLLSTNFHSTPDLGFTIYPLAHSYAIIIQNNELEYGELQGLLKQYFLKAGEALSVGGIHTPNHRWVVSGALARLNHFFPNPKYKKRINEWLAEKIDIDPDGQYHERSTAVYTPLTNNCLIDIAQTMNLEYLYEHVRKNLDMTFYYVRSNGEIATESSDRQDKYIVSNMSNYFHAYNYMALLDKNRRYAGMVDYIFKTASKEQLLYMLPRFLADSSLLGELPEPVSLPDNYQKFFSYSDIVRVRKGERDMSVMNNNTTFFTYFKGTAALEAVRLSSSFFGKGQFNSQTIERQGETYVLSSTIYGPYYQPLPLEKIPEKGEAWSQVARSEREQSEVQTLAVKIYITEKDGKARIKVSVQGPENLPVTLELGFRKGGTLYNVDKKQDIENAYLMKNGEYAQYIYNSDTLKVGPLNRAHRWTQLRGALPKLPAESLYATYYAPCVFEFTIE